MDQSIYLSESDIATYQTFTSAPDVNNLQPFLGMSGRTRDGRTFRWVTFGGTATIFPGVLVTGPIAPANSTRLAINSTSAATANVTANLQAGSHTLVITNGGTAVTADQFQYLEINVNNAGSYKLRISGHPAAAINAALTVLLADPLPQNITQLIPGTDTVNLRYSPYNSVNISTTAGVPVGITVNSVPMSANQWVAAWVQTSGPIYVGATSTVAAGAAVSQDVTTTAGNVITATTNSFPVGVAQYDATFAKLSIVLNIPSA